MSSGARFSRTRIASFCDDSRMLRRPAVVSDMNVDRTGRSRTRSALGRGRRDLSDLRSHDHDELLAPLEIGTSPGRFHCREPTIPFAALRFAPLFLAFLLRERSSTFVMSSHDDRPSEISRGDHSNRCRNRVRTRIAVSYLDPSSMAFRDLSPSRLRA